MKQLVVFIFASWVLLYILHVVFDLFSETFVVWFCGITIGAFILYYLYSLIRSRN